MFASDTPGWRADREIYGYPRQQADVEIAAERGKLPTTLSVSARAIKRFSEDALAKDERILRVVKTSAAAGQEMARDSIAKHITAALGAAELKVMDRHVGTLTTEPRLGITASDASFFERFPCDAAPDEDSDPSLIGPISFEEALRLRSFPMLFLKQFRDIVFVDRACYQAIVEASFDFSSEIDGRAGRDFELYLEDIDSVPIGRELGIPTGVAIPVEFGFRLDVNEIRIGPAKVISNPYWTPAFEFSTTDEPTRLPMFVDRGGEAVWRHPSLLFGARIFGFGVEVPLSRQKDMLDRLVNDVVDKSNSTYGSRPFRLAPCDGVDMVMLLFVEYERITSGNEEDRRLGGSSYREFLVTQLAISDDPEYPELDWFIPYICLDTDAPRLGGREIFGYPKQLAKIPPFELFPARGSAVAPAKRLTVKATVFQKPESPASDREIVRVKLRGRQRPTIDAYSSAVDMFLDLWRNAHRSHFSDQAIVRAAGHSGRPGLNVLNALFMNRIGDVFLKEFRDCEKPEVACYQAVCKTDTIPAKFHGGGCVEASQYRIEIANIASEPLRSYLEPLRQAHPDGIEPKMAYVLNVDLELTTGRIIANPLASAYAIPDTSLPRTTARATRFDAGLGRQRRADEREQPADRRVPSFAEPYWRR
jgi:hypothetical protein